MTFGELFWPVFAAMIASGICFEIFHFGLGLLLSWRQMKRAQKMKEEIAAKMGVDPSQLDLMSDMYGGGGFPMMDFPMGGQDFPPTVSGNADERGHGQYL